MGGGGGDTTNVTNTGLGDDQYQALADNQVGISGQITDARNDATVRYDNFDNRFDNLDTSVGGVSNNLTSGFTNLQDLMKEYNDSRTASNVAAFDPINTGLNANNAAIGQNTTARDTLSGDVTGGFDEMGQRFNTVDQANQNLQTSVDTGFEDQATAMNELETGMNTQFDDANAALNESFAATGEALQEGFGATSEQMTETQRNVLEGQGGLQTNLDALSGNVDTYANQQLANQEALAQGQSGFQSSFDNYVDRYTDDTTLANQTRADLATAQANATQRLREDIGDYAQATATGQQDIANQNAENTAAVTDALQGGFQQSAQTSQNLRDVLSRQFDETSEGLMNNQELMAETQGAIQEGQANLANLFTTESGEIDAALINQTKNLAGIAATQSDLDMGMRQNFNQLSQAFDDNGQLIQNSIDQNGNTIMREMDQNGNLMLRAMDAQGRDMGNKIINVADSVGQLQALQRKAGANISMGNLSPTSQGAIPTGGFASPFTTTQ